MTHEHLEPDRASGAELEARQRAAQTGAPFLVFRDAQQRQRIHVLEGRGPVTVGRAPDAAIAVTWDDGVSRKHARFELVGDDPASDWTVVDDGPSRNGTFVNGRRVRGRVRLQDGDNLAFADTAMLFCAATATRRDTLLAPGLPRDDTTAAIDSPTIVSGARLTRESLSDGERRVLAALAKPVRRSGGSAPPADDEKIARDTYLGVDTVRRMIEGMCLRVGLHRLPAEEQRRGLVEHALRSGVLDES